MSVPHIKHEEDEDLKLYNALFQELSRPPSSGGSNANFGYDVQHSHGYGLPHGSDLSRGAIAQNPADSSSIYTQQYCTNPIPAYTDECKVPSVYYGDHATPTSTSLDPGYNSLYESRHTLASFEPQAYSYRHPIPGQSSNAGGLSVSVNQQPFNAYISPYPPQGYCGAEVSQQENTFNDENIKRSVAHQTQTRFGKLYDLLAKKKGVDPSYWPTNTMIQMTQYDKRVIFGGDSNRPWNELIDHSKVQLETEEDVSKVIIKCNDPTDVLVYTLQNATLGIFHEYNKSIKNITSVSLEELAQGGFLPVIACQSTSSVSERIGKTRNEIVAQSRSYFPRAENLHNNVATEYSTSKGYPYCTECGDYSRFLNAGYKAKANKPGTTTDH
ncbi:hypothetical protein V866_002613 [Kwoniella sp. B9012]